ncbi:MAG TPA: VWA domain-containing protein [Solirubrobacteraceae bacterium]|nr:VWA domain-containing protein [Solirubrobacteraceae bacterium]
MSFASPWWLLGLGIIPVLLVGAWLARRRARRFALRFTAVDSLGLALAQVGPARWRGRLVPLLLVLGLASGGVALARPQMPHRVPYGRASVVLVLDHSGSMAADDVAPTRIAAAIGAANTFIDEIPANVAIGFVGFGTTPDAVQQPVADHASARRLLDAQTAGGGTDTGPALALALQLLDARSAHHPPSAIVLLSDGAANEGVDPVAVAAQARAAHIPIDTVALGTPNGTLTVSPFAPPVPVPPDPQLMAQIAHTSGGRTFDARTADQLSSIYRSLGAKLGSAERERDLTLWPLALAAALLLGGLALLAPASVPPVRVRSASGG